MDSCFVLFGTRQHGVANLNNASERANANRLPNVHYIKFRSLNSLVPRITHCHITCFGGQGDQSVTMMSHKTLKQGTANENAAKVGSNKGSDQRENDK